jgi:5'' nucleotidase, deoxy (Pyrimidine), cytosolic type C protein (NT5C).
MRIHPLAPVVAVDIDGTIGDYYEHFRWFAELYLQKPVTIDWEYSDSAEFSEALNIDKAVYRQIKLAYRQGGMKRSLPVFPGAGHTIRTLREKHGVQVWIATTRPWQRLDNIDPDTQFWLKRNIGRVDGVIYGEDKYLDLMDIVGANRIIGVVDDLPENVVAAQSLGMRAMLKAGNHNAVFRKVRQGVPVAHDCSEMLDIFQEWIGERQEAKAS